MEIASKEEAEPLVLIMCQFLNTNTDAESLFLNTPCVYVHTGTGTDTHLGVMFINSAPPLSAYRSHWWLLYSARGRPI